MKHRICHITVVHQALDVRIFHKECVTLSQAGYDVHLIAPHDKEELIQGVHIHPIPPKQSKLKQLLLLPWFALWEALSIKPTPSLFQIHDPGLLPLLVLLKLLTHAKTVCDYHEDIAGQILTKYWIPRPVRSLVSGFVRLCNSMGLIGTGVIEADMIEGLYRQPKQSVRNLPLLNRKKIPIRSRDHFTGRQHLVYVGAVSEIRGAMAMLKLADALRSHGLDFDLTIIGKPAPPSLETRMANYVQEKALQQHVHLHGRKPYPIAMEAIRKSTAGLCLLAPVPNYMYSLSTKILEYMAYGLPVIMSNVYCCRQYLEYCKGGIIVDYHDIQGMADGACSLLQNPGRMHTMSRTAQNIVLNELNWDQTESRLLLHFYRRVLCDDLLPAPCFPHKPRKPRKTRYFDR